MQSGEASSRRAIRVLALWALALLPPMQARAYIDIDADSSSQGGRRMNQCQITGEHVSGIVSVDMQNGTRGEVVLVDVKAVMIMAPGVTDIGFYVSRPLAFQGTFVPHDLGGPAAYANRGYRSPLRNFTLRPRIPVEIALAPGGTEARVLVPSPFGGGSLEVIVPCSALSAGAPRAHMPQPRVRFGPREHYVEINPGTVITSAPGREGAHVARINGIEGNPARVIFVGTVRAATNGFMRVKLVTPAVTVEGFVHESFIAKVDGQMIEPGTPGAYAYPTRSLEARTRIVDFPHGTRIFADGAATRPWAVVQLGVRGAYIPPQAGQARGVISLGDIDVPPFPCRYDGVLGYLACEAPRGMPPIGLRACSGSTCVERAFVDPL